MSPKDNVAAKRMIIEKNLLEAIICTNSASISKDYRSVEPHAISFSRASFSLPALKEDLKAL